MGSIRFSNGLLVLSLVQLDELYAQVKDSEQARWLWLVMDPLTKGILSYIWPNAKAKTPARCP